MKLKTRQQYGENEKVFKVCCSLYNIKKADLLMDLLGKNNMPAEIHG